MTLESITAALRIPHEKSNLKIVKAHEESKAAILGTICEFLAHFEVGFPSEDEFGILTGLS